MNPNMPPKKKRFVIAGFILLGLFILLSLLEEFGAFRPLDPFLTKLSQSLIPRTLDTTLSFFSVLGSIEVTTLILGIIALFLLKKEKLIPYSLGLFALIMIIELIGKFFIYHPAPPKEFFRYALPFVTPHYIGSTFSFPSGHTARTAFLGLVAILLAYKYVKQKPVKVTLYIGLAIIIAIMAVSRVYLGEHWSSDVLGGLLLGGAFGFLAMVYY